MTTPIASRALSIVRMWRHLVGLPSGVGVEAVAESGESHGCFPSQKEAAVALQQVALHATCCGD
jgi:hypothetical protein